jgi:hypothetical protein
MRWNMTSYALVMRMLFPDVVLESKGSQASSPPSDNT